MRNSVDMLVRIKNAIRLEESDGWREGERLTREQRAMSLSFIGACLMRYHEKVENTGQKFDFENEILQFFKAAFTKEEADEILNDGIMLVIQRAEERGEKVSVH